MIKKSVLWITPLILIFSSCQTSNSLEIETDEYPEIPFFPKISDSQIYLNPIEIGGLNFSIDSLDAFKDYDNFFINSNDSTFNTFKSIVVATSKSPTFKEGFPQGNIDLATRMHYYDINFKGITSNTKIDYTKQLCPQIIRKSNAVYFLYQDKVTKTLKVYQLLVKKNND
ncbi:MULTISPECIES: hypothetical protein [Pedobacter]|uniref:hypothetical protein n=1 Tax=Pedobacter TaxID=84567 RepID=UPI001E3B4A1D|nr:MULTISPECIES: hypothetical protein [Pedobacter]